MFESYGLIKLYFKCYALIKWMLNKIDIFPNEESMCFSLIFVILYLETPTDKYKLNLKVLNKNIKNPILYESLIYHSPASLNIRVDIFVILW